MMEYRYRTFLRIGAGLAAGAAAMPAVAQDGAPGQEEILVTAQRANQTEVTRGGSVGVLGEKPAEDVPFAIKSYNSALIINQQPQTLGQVLENDPSIRTGQGFGNAAELFVIRGFALAGDDIGFDGLYGIAPRQLIAPELYESVQVLNGASAFLNGAAPGGSGLGGSVNLTPKRAEGRQVARLTGNFTSSEHLGGSFDYARRFGANGEFGIRLNGAARRGDVSIDEEFRSAYVLGGALDYDAGPLRLSLDLAYQKMRVEHQRPEVIIGDTIPQVPGADVNYGQPWMFTQMRDVFGQVRAEYDLADNAMVYAAFGARDGAEGNFSQSLTLLDAETGDASVSGSYIPRTDNNEAAQAGLRVQLERGGITHEVNLGGSMLWQVNRNAYEFYATVPELNNIYDPIAVPQPSEVTFAGGNLADPFPISRNRLWSLFASDTIGLWDDRLLLTAGVRMQTINQKAYANTDGSLQTEYDETAISPAFGIVLKPAPGLSLYVNRMQGFEPGPTAPQEVGGLPVENAGEVFPPTGSTQYEAGVKLALGRLNASLALFQIDRPRPSAVEGETPESVVYGVFGEQRNKGIEFSVDGEVAHGLRIIAGASLIDAKLRRTQDGVNQGNNASGVPDYMVNANVEWDLPFLPAATLTGRVVHTGKQAVGDANLLELPEWTRIDLGVRYVALIGERATTFRLGVDNVANERYWASAFDSFRPDLLQGAPRTYKASISIDF